MGKISINISADGNKWNLWLMLILKKIKCIKTKPITFCSANGYYVKDIGPWGTVLLKPIRFPVKSFLSNHLSRYFLASTKKQNFVIILMVQLWPYITIDRETKDQKSPFKFSVSMIMKAVWPRCLQNDYRNKRLTYTGQHNMGNICKFVHYILCCCGSLVCIFASHFPTIFCFQILYTALGLETICSCYKDSFTFSVTHLPHIAWNNFQSTPIQASSKINGTFACV